MKLVNLKFFREVRVYIRMFKNNNSNVSNILIETLRNMRNFNRLRSKMVIGKCKQEVGKDYLQRAP